MLMSVPSLSCSDPVAGKRDNASLTTVGLAVLAVLAGVAANATSIVAHSKESVAT